MRDKELNSLIILLIMFLVLLIFLVIYNDKRNKNISKYQHNYDIHTRLKSDTTIKNADTLIIKVIIEK